MPTATIAAGAAVVLLLLRDSFGGPLRMILESLRLSALWFIPDAVVSAALAWLIYGGMKSSHPARRTLAMGSIALVVFPALVGYFSGNPPVAIVSHYKIFAVLLLGLNAPLLLEELIDRYFILWIALLAATFTFLCLNQFIKFEWVGATISQFGHTKDVSRLWWAEGVGQRYAGATVASVSAAALCVLFYTFMRPKLKNVWLELLVFAVCAYSIYLTNSKTTYFCLAIVFIAGNARNLPKNIKTLFRYDPLEYVRVCASYCMLAAGLVPVVVAWFNEPNNFYSGENSFMSRVVYTWPSALRRIYDLSGVGGFVYGTGYGSVGSPAYYSQKYIAITSDVDNFLIYQITIFGLGIIVLYYLCTRIVLKAETAALCLFAAFIPSALTTNCEMPENMIALGCAIGAVLYGRNKVQFLPWKTKLKVVV